MGLIYMLCALFLGYISYSDALDSIVKRVFDTFDFQGKLGLLQFWEYSPSGDSEDCGCYLFLTDQFLVSDICDTRLGDYRRTCLNNNFRLVGREKNVGNWSAGRAAQTMVADYQHDGEASAMGQLVMPVYHSHPGAGLKLAGIIELVTTDPKESYFTDFNQIQSSLMRENLTSTCLGKTVKVKYNNHMVKFAVPFSAKLPDLENQVTMRFKELESKNFRIKYEDSNHNPHYISSDLDLELCIAESISNRTTVIRMSVEHVVGQ